MCLRIIVVLSLLTTPFVAQVPLDRSGERGTVHILAVDPFGKPLASAQISVEKIDSATRAITSPVSAEMTLDYGKYVVRVTHPGFNTISRAIEVDARESSIIAALPIGDIEKTADQSVVVGRIMRSKTESQCDVIRLVPLLLQLAPVEARISSAGLFSFENVTPGAYAGVLLGPTGICKILHVGVLKQRFQRVELGGKGGLP